MGPQHALLCVKQAVAYLEDPESFSTIVETLFDGDEHAARTCIGKGAGQDVVLKLLAGSWTEHIADRPLTDNELQYWHASITPHQMQLSAARLERA